MTRGRTKKIPAPNSTVNEGTISIPHVVPNSNNVETTEDQKSNTSKNGKKPSELTSSSARRSLRLVGKKRATVRFNLAKETSGPQVGSLTSHVQEASPKPSANDIEISNDETMQSLKVKIKKHPTSIKGKQGSAVQRKKVLKSLNADTLPNSTERDLEKETPANNLETTDMGNTVHLHSSGPPEKKTAESIRQSSRNKRKTRSFVPSSPVSPKQKASKREKVIVLPSSTGRSSEEQVPPVHGPNIVPILERKKKDKTGPYGRYQSLYKSAEKKIEQLMADNIELSNKFHFERGKVEAYEKLMNVVIGCAPPANAAGDAPETSQRRIVSSPARKNNQKCTKKQDVAAA